MAELISGPLTDSLAEQQMGQQAFQATPGEGMEAAAASVLHSLPTAAFSRAEQRRGLQGTAPTTDFTGGIGSMPYNPEEEQLPHAPTVTIPAEDANAQVKASGAQMTPFTSPTHPDVVKRLIDDHLAEQKRADVVDRSATTILNNPVTRFGVGTLLTLVDPANTAAFMFPVAPEAFVAAKLAAAGGVAGRTAIRAGFGAAQGAAGMAALEPLTAFNDYQEHTEWSAGEALRNIAFGALGGAVLHAGFGAIGDRLKRLDPETQQAVLKASVAQQMEGRPLDVQAIIDHGEAKVLREAPVLPQREGNAPPANTVPTPTTPEAPTLPPEIKAKLDNIDRQLADPSTPEATRVVLEKARQETVASAEPPVREVAAEVAAARPITLDKFLGHEDKEGTSIYVMRDEHGEQVGEISVDWNSETKDLRINTIRSDDLGTAGMLQVRRQMQSLYPDIKTISGMRITGSTEGKGGVEVTRAVGQAQASARDMANRALNPEPDPEIVRATRANAAAIERAPKLDATPDKNLIEITERATEVKARYDAEVAAGRLQEHPSIAEIGKDIEANGKAAADYAVCSAGRGG